MLFVALSDMMEKYQAGQTPSNDIFSYIQTANMRIAKRAIIALHMNIPIATISEGMGHNSFKITQIYLQSLDVATINEANKKIIQQVIAARF